MIESLQISWPAVLSAFAGIGYFVLIRWTWPFRDRPGAIGWVAVLGAGGWWALTYGAALTVFDPAIRPLFEIPLWIARPLAAGFVLAFALGYTGRNHVLRSKWMGAVFAVLGLAAVAYASTPWTGIMWSGYAIEPVAGAAAVNYQPNLLGVGVALFAYLLNTLAIVLLLDSMLSYGALYRRQVIALSLVIALPTIANFTWLFRLGPASHLDLTPISFLPCALAATYAMFREGMFDVLPATRRIGDRVAIDDLGTAVVVVTPGGRVTGCNRTAADLFERDQAALMRRPLSDLFDEEFRLEPTSFAVSDPAGRTREYVAEITPIGADSGQDVGYTVTFQDVTAERLRQQRLNVLNRFLRHNLRNSTNVVYGCAQLVEERVAGTDAAEETAPLVGTILDTAEDLVRTAEKARSIETALSKEASGPTWIDLPAVLASVASQLEERCPDAEIEILASEACRIRARRPLLKLVVENVVENAIVHNDGARVEVRVGRASEDPSTIAIDVTDDGGGIPEHELSVLDRGAESPLEHGSGLGLWIVSWGVRMLGGTVTFDADADGTTVSIRLPEDEGAVEPEMGEPKEDGSGRDRPPGRD